MFRFGDSLTDGSRLHYLIVEAFSPEFYFIMMTVDSLIYLVTRSIRLKGLDSQSRFDADIQASIQRKVCVEELVSRWVCVIRKYDWEVRLSVGVIWDDPFSLSLPLPLPTRVFNFTLSTPPPLPFSLILALSKPTTD